MSDPASSFDVIAADANDLAASYGRLSLRRQWIFSFLSTTLIVVGAITCGAYWFADFQTGREVEKRLSSIGHSLASPNYPMTPAVLRAVAELTDSQLVLLDRAGKVIDTTLATRDAASGKATVIDLANIESFSGMKIDRAFRADDGKLYHVGWMRFEGTESPGRPQPIAWVGILIEQFTVRQMRWQALVLPLITGLFTAVALSGIAAWLTDRVVRRLQSVQRTVQRIAAGDYAPIVLAGGRDELYELSANVNRMAEELRLMESRIHATERDRLIHSLAAGLSHDLRHALAKTAGQLYCADRGGHGCNLRRGGVGDQPFSASATSDPIGSATLPEQRATIP